MAKTDVTYAYVGDIVKMDKQPDGLMIYGRAAGPGVDLDGQRFDAEWLKTAMPDWMKFGNIREQHNGLIAAGVGKELIAGKDGEWYVKALIVDPGTVRKIEAGVLKGLSVGVKKAHLVKDHLAPNGRIAGGKVVELSVVDRPADPPNIMTICKAAGMTNDLMAVDTSGDVVLDHDADLAKAAGPLTPDLRKAALATIQGVLHGDLVKGFDETGDIDGADGAIRLLAKFIQHEAAALAASDLNEPRDVDELLKAARALECFTEADEDEDAADVTKAAVSSDTRSNGGTLLFEAEITKAVAQATQPLEAKIHSLQADLAKAMAAPMPGGPVLITQPVMPPAAKTAEAERLAAIAARTPDPELAMMYRQAAKSAEQATA